jgi:hypothetical protein
LIAVPLRVVDRLKVFVAAFTTKYCVAAVVGDVVSPVGKAPVLVKTTTSPFLSPLLLQVKTPGEAMVTVKVWIGAEFILASVNRYEARMLSTVVASVIVVPP